MKYMENKDYLYRDAPVSKAIITLVVPTILSQLITVFYNMADTFFIGQLNDPDQVAAATLSMPIFVVLTGIANLFGIGGASLFSRSLGKNDRKKAERCSSFAILTSAGVALVYGIMIYFLAPVILPYMGCDEATFAYTRSYLFWTVTIGAIPTVLSAEIAHLIRAEGYSREAGFGIAMGGILNILFDPIFIFLLKLKIQGAAIATMAANLCALIYYLHLINKKQCSVNYKFQNYSVSDNIPKEVLLTGLPSCIMMCMSLVSNVCLNKLVSGYSNEAIAGMGIAKKIDMLVMAIANGMSQGVISLIAYNYSAKNYKRMTSSIRMTVLYSFVLSFFAVLFLSLGAPLIMKFFINDASTIAYGQHFLKVICLSCPCVAVLMMIITIFQAVGKKMQPTFLSFLRKGALDVPFMFLMRKLAGSSGIPWATPISDTLAMLIAIILFYPFYKKSLKEINYEQ